MTRLRLMRDSLRRGPDWGRERTFREREHCRASWGGPEARPQREKRVPGAAGRAYHSCVRGSSARSRTPARESPMRSVRTLVSILTLLLTTTHAFAAGGTFIR